MKVIDAQTSILYIERLVGILGVEWCNRELTRYGEFAEKYSPTGMWSHRLPTTSPIIPLLFQYRHPELRERYQDTQLGYWYGDPVYFLQELACYIFLFEKFWSGLPDSRGIKNIKHRLTHHFNGFWFELLVAVGYKSIREYGNYEIKPLFFDSATLPGIPDIILQQGGEQIAIQCKARSPLSASTMSYEEFQYLFGRFFRLIQDSGNSYRLSIHLRAKLDVAGIDELLKLLASAILSGLEIPKHAVSDSCYVELTRLPIPLSGLTRDDLRRIMDKERPNLFGEISGSGSEGSAVTKVALCSVSANHRISAMKWVADTVKEAAREAQGTIPLIIAIHLYQHIHWENYLNETADSRRLINRLDPIFKSNPRIKHIKISSNRRRFSSPNKKETALRTPGVQFDNPYFQARHD